MRKKITRVLRQKSGVSMVEVLIAFLVVVMMMGAFSLIVSTAINLTNRRNAMIDADQTFQVDYYKSPDKRTEGTTEEITTTISLVLNQKKTDAKNNASNLPNGLELPKAKLQKYTHENGIYRYYVETDSNGNTQP